MGVRDCLTTNKRVQILSGKSISVQLNLKRKKKKKVKKGNIFVVKHLHSNFGRNEKNDSKMNGGVDDYIFTHFHFFLFLIPYSPSIRQTLIVADAGCCVS